jgi:PAS domain S-box-containing protein
LAPFHDILAFSKIAVFLVQFFGVGTVLWGRNIIRWSKEAERIFGWTSAEVLGKSISQMKWVFEQDIAQVNQVSNGFISGETPQTLNINHNYRKDSSVIACEWYNSAIYNSDGKMVSVLSLVNDITQRQEAEESLKKYARELEEANKELEAFSYSVSHDLRAPLRTLDGFSQMVLEDCSGILDEKNRDYLNRIRNASQLMSQLIDDILRLSRVGRAEMNCLELDLSQITQSILDEFKSSAPARKLKATIQPELKVCGDPALLKIMLQNLLENAWKYTGRCEQAEINFGCRDYNEEEVFFVQDNGAGFNMKYADKLFQPFQRLHAKEEYEGTGIGLAIVQRIIRRHGGRIWAESEVEKGTTFFFTIPHPESTYFYHE